MGHGTYSTTLRSTRAEAAGYTTMSSQQIFTQRNINNAMHPYGLSIRESRDSIEHPNSVPIIIALDVTGSMGSIPHFLVKEGLPNIMQNIIDHGIVDPQVLFLGIGDHECDQAPIQVGQFESSDELLDKWLTDIWLEGHGGGNDGESYHLAWYAAAKHTETDSFTKRGQKGFLFTIGDEPVLSNLPMRSSREIFGDNEDMKDYTSLELLEEAMKTYNVYHIHIKETNSGRREYIIDGWRQLLSDHLIVAERKTDVAQIISDVVCANRDASATRIRPLIMDEAVVDEIDDGETP